MKTPRLEDDHVTADNYGSVSDFVYGGIDGAVTTFAVVAGVAGAELSTAIILILGFANLFADGFSMSIGKYLSDKTTIDQYKKIQSVEHGHLKTYPAHERREVQQYLKQYYGFKGERLREATEQITAEPNRWVDFMMRHEFNFNTENVNPLKGALVTFIAFVVIGFIPLGAYVFGRFFDADQATMFTLTCFFTILALFIVGLIKAKFTMTNRWISGLQTAALGGGAAAISYVVGALLKNLAG